MLASRRHSITLEGDADAICYQEPCQDRCYAVSESGLALNSEHVSKAHISVLETIPLQ